MPGPCGIKLLAVQAAVALPQLKASLLGHEVKFSGPGVADDHRQHVHAPLVESDDLGGDALLGGVVAGHFQGSGILGHVERPHGFTAVETGLAWDKAFDYEDPARWQHPRYIAE